MANFNNTKQQLFCTNLNRTSFSILPMLFLNFFISTTVSVLFRGIIEYWKEKRPFLSFLSITIHFYFISALSYHFLSYPQELRVFFQSIL